MLPGPLPLPDDEAVQRIVGRTQNARFCQELFGPDPKRAGLFQATGFLKQELLHPPGLWFAESAFAQVATELLLVFRQCRLALGIGLDQLGWKVKLETDEGEQLLVNLKGLLGWEAVGQAHKG